MSDAIALNAVAAQIREACARAGRDPESVRLIAATKTVAAERIRAAGVLDAGENRVQEMLEKQHALQDLPITWHFIGTLQPNKVRKVVGRVALIHSVDTQQLAEKIDQAAHDLGIVQHVLVQVNVSGEPSKSGVAPSAAPGLVRLVNELKHVSVRGLMTIPAPGDPAGTRRAYRELAGLAASLDVPELSMGMSEDFEVAIAEGATMVRVGTAIFGDRP